MPSHDWADPPSAAASRIAISALTVARPLTIRDSVILDASGNEIPELRLVGFEDADAFLKRLERAEGLVSSR